MWVGFSQVLIHATIEPFNNGPLGSLLSGWRRGRSLSPIHELRDTCTSMCNGIRTPGRLPVNGFQDYGSLYPTLPVDANESLYRGLLGV